MRRYGYTDFFVWFFYSWGALLSLAAFAVGLSIYEVANVFLIALAFVIFGGSLAMPIFIYVNFGSFKRGKNHSLTIKIIVAIIALILLGLSIISIQIVFSTGAALSWVFFEIFLAVNLFIHLDRE